MTESQFNGEPLTDQDRADLETLSNAENVQDLHDDHGVTYHPILKVWDEFLTGAAASRTGRVGPTWALQLVSKHPEIALRDTPEVVDRYFDKIADLHQVLKHEISTDPNCLTYRTVEEDREENREHYLNLLLGWQSQLLIWDLEWDATDEDAAIEVAALSEVHALFFGPNQLSSHLEAIGFEFTETDQADMQAALQELKEES